MSLKDRSLIFRAVVEAYSNDFSNSGKHSPRFIKQAVMSEATKPGLKADPRMTSTDLGAVAAGVGKHLLTHEGLCKDFVDLEITGVGLVATFLKGAKPNMVAENLNGVGQVSRICQPGDTIGEGIIADVLIVAIEPAPAVMEACVATFKESLTEGRLDEKWWNTAVQRIKGAYKALTTATHHIVTTKLKPEASSTDIADLHAKARSLGGGSYSHSKDAADTAPEAMRRAKEGEVIHAFHNDADAKTFASHAKAQGHSPKVGGAVKANPNVKVESKESPVTAFTEAQADEIAGPLTLMVEEATLFSHELVVHKSVLPHEKLAGHLANWNKTSPAKAGIAKKPGTAGTRIIFKNPKHAEQFKHSIAAVHDEPGEALEKMHVKPINEAVIAAAKALESKQVTVRVSTLVNHIGATKTHSVAERLSASSGKVVAEGVKEYIFASSGALDTFLSEAKAIVSGPRCVKVEVVESEQIDEAEGKFKKHAEFVTADGKYAFRAGRNTDYGTWDHRAYKKTEGGGWKHLEDHGYDGHDSKEDATAAAKADHEQYEKHGKMDESSLDKMNLANVASHARTAGYHTAHAEVFGKRGDKDREDDAKDAVDIAKEKFAKQSVGTRWASDISKHPEFKKGYELGQRHGLDEAEVGKIDKAVWAKAEAAAVKQYGAEMREKDSDKFYAITMSIYKKMAGVTEAVEVLGEGLHSDVSKSLNDAGMGGSKLFASPGEGWAALNGALDKHGLMLHDEDHRSDDKGNYQGVHQLAKKPTKDGEAPSKIEGAYLNIARTAGVGDREGADGADMPMKGRHEFNVYLTGKKLKESFVPRADRTDLEATKKEAQAHADKNGDPAHVVKSWVDGEYSIIGDKTWKNYEGRPHYEKERIVHTAHPSTDESAGYHVGFIAPGGVKHVLHYDPKAASSATNQYMPLGQTNGFVPVVLKKKSDAAAYKAEGSTVRAMPVNESVDHSPEQRIHAAAVTYRQYRKDGHRHSDAMSETQFDHALSDDEVERVFDLVHASKNESVDHSPEKHIKALYEHAYGKDALAACNEANENGKAILKRMLSQFALPCMPGAANETGNSAFDAVFKASVAKTKALRGVLAEADYSTLVDDVAFALVEHFGDDADKTLASEVIPAFKAPLHESAGPNPATLQQIAKALLLSADVVPESLSESIQSWRDHAATLPA